MISAVGQTSVCLMVFICHDITFNLCVSSVINNMMIEGITIRVIFCCDYSSFVVVVLIPWKKAFLFWRWGKLRQDSHILVCVHA